MSNNSLIPVKESVFLKIRNFFKKLFGIQTIEEYVANTSESIAEGQQENCNPVFAENMKVEETEEQKLLNLQRMIREKRISENELSVEEKDKLRKLYNLQIETLRNSILEKRNRIMNIRYEQKRKSHATRHAI